ncbi:MAG: Asp-tRNA(Asn)/Glu-tRNA(Gln) amidotransferase subunit GatC [Acetatifactor sp.]
MEGRIDQDTIQRLCGQAKLTLSPEERESIRKDIDRVIAYFAKIDELDTSDTLPLFSVQDQSNVFRVDEAQEYAGRTEEVLSNAPEKKGDFPVVPKIVS